MQQFKLDNMTKGWFVGAFEPAALKSTAAEVAMKQYKQGDVEELHHHKIATEVTLVASGTVRMCDKVWVAGDIIVMEPGEATAFEALTDATCVVVKTPSCLGDKYVGHA
jgi:quercetin dioxygenase-like cupin family protein